jgi:hypothetical protein
MSPMLMTLGNGSQCGVAMMSPRKARTGWCTSPLLANSFGSILIPALASAVGEAGNVPSFKVMVTAFSKAPMPMITSPGSRRFAQTTNAARTYVATWAVTSSACGAPGTTTVIRICTARAARITQV